MERRVITISGTVQGVGFRPFVYGLASGLDLGGTVRNETGGVRIEVEGEAGSLDQFLAQLISKPPPLARIEGCSCETETPRGDRRFLIEQSADDSTGAVVVTPDAGTCDACLAELFDPRDRRYRYPFLNCTNCGPRLTIVTGAPYDRHRTTMGRFTMCPACRAEYENPLDRRFHAQPNACPVCGPRLAALDGRGEPVRVDDPLAWFVSSLRAGQIGAMKGLGGYHLVCDARNTRAVEELRGRKHRDEKPFAIMVGDLAAVERLCETDLASRALLTSPARPIVLLRKRSDAEIASAVAPGNPFLGIMLPYTPLHHLLLHDMDGTPLIMTSGNRADEPIASDEPDAIARLSGIADLFLIHDRPIHVRSDDSVTRVIDVAESPLRRSRGYAPQPIPLPIDCPQPILAVGGQMKGTFALGTNRRAILSHHLGDLDHPEAYRAFERDTALYEKLFSFRPACIAHDLHPDYASTRYALRRAATDGVKRVAVQHHHAHMASCMAEHGLNETVIGVTFDGTGFGTDVAIWGGEFLVGDYAAFRRAAHLRHVGMPGGEAAVREPWRMAAAYLLDAQCPCAPYEQRIPASSLRTLRQMLDRRFNTPLTSSAGRLFDAVASLAGLRDRVIYEGQAAMQLEWLATPEPLNGIYPFEIVASPSNSFDPAPLEIDTRPMIRTIALEASAGAPAAQIARRFHRTLVEMIAAVCTRLRASTGLSAVVLSGGVFMNALLSVEACQRLREDGFRVYRHRLVPPNDGGLSLGQIAVAAATGSDTRVQAGGRACESPDSSAGSREESGDSQARPPA